MLPCLFYEQRKDIALLERKIRSRFETEVFILIAIVVSVTVRTSACTISPAWKGGRFL
jgi:hypothetical protein